MKKYTINFKRIASTLALNYIQDNAFVMLDAELKLLSESLAAFLNTETKTVSEKSGFLIKTGLPNFAIKQLPGAKLKLLPNNGSLQLEITPDAQSIGLAETDVFTLDDFKGDWQSAWEKYQAFVLQAQEKEFESATFTSNSVIRKDGTVVSVTGFCYGAFGLGSIATKTTVASYPEARWLAESFGKESGFTFNVSRPSKFAKPFIELTDGYTLTVPVKKVKSDKPVYSFFCKKELEFEVIESTDFGDEIRIDKIRDRDSGWTYQQGINSVHTDVISAHINRYER